MTEHLMTDREMAGMVGKSLWFVQEKCKGEQPEWPHLRIGKSIRFTSDDVAAILELTRVRPSAPEPVEGDGWGRRGRSAS